MNVLTRFDLLPLAWQKLILKLYGFTGLFTRVYEEILAGRGFWPGLCTTLKHSCRFASFTLLAKGDYPAELCVPLPFLISSNCPPLLRR